MLCAQPQSGNSKLTSRKPDSKICDRNRLRELLILFFITVSEQNMSVHFRHSLQYLSCRMPELINLVWTAVHSDTDRRYDLSSRALALNSWTSPTSRVAFPIETADRFSLRPRKVGYRHGTPKKLHTAFFAITLPTLNQFS